MVNRVLTCSFPNSRGGMSTLSTLSHYRSRLDPEFMSRRLVWNITTVYEGLRSQGRPVQRITLECQFVSYPLGNDYGPGDKFTYGP